MPPPIQNSYCASGSDFLDDLFWWQFLSIHIYQILFIPRPKNRLNKVLQVYFEARGRMLDDTWWCLAAVILFSYKRAICILSLYWWTRRPAIPWCVRPLKRVQTIIRAVLLPSEAVQRHIGGCTWPVLVSWGCWRSGKDVCHMNFGGQPYKGVSGNLKGSKPALGQLYCLQKLFRDRDNLEWLIISDFATFDTQNLVLDVFIINKTVALSTFSFLICFWLKSSSARLVSALDDLSQKQTLAIPRGVRPLKRVQICDCRVAFATENSDL